MDHIGIDVHKRDSQIYIRRGRRGDRAAHPDGAGALRRRAWDPAPRSDCARGPDRQRWGVKESPPPGCTPAVAPRRWHPRPGGGTMNTEERDASVDHERHPTTWWTRLDDGRVHCDVCPRACKLHEGQRGLCFVRARAGERDRAHDLRALERLLHRPDREKAAQPFPARDAGALVRHRRLQPGCKFCQNWDISKSREIDTLADAASPERDRRRRRAARLPRAWRSPTTTR